MYILDSSMDGSCELIASITSEDAAIILLFLGAIINQHKEAAEMMCWRVTFSTRRVRCGNKISRARLVSNYREIIKRVMKMTPVLGVENRLSAGICVHTLMGADIPLGSLEASECGVILPVSTRAVHATCGRSCGRQWWDGTSGVLVCGGGGSRDAWPCSGAGLGSAQHFSKSLSKKCGAA